MKKLVVHGMLMLGMQGKEGAQDKEAMQGKQGM